MLPAMAKSIKNVKPKEWNNIPIPVSELLALIGVFCKYSYKTQENNDTAIETLLQQYETMNEYFNEVNEQMKSSIRDRI